MTQVRMEDVWPLSPLQEGLLFHAGYDEQARDVYVVQGVVNLSGSLDTAVLRASWEALLERHASLRASFQRRGSGVPVQVIARGVALPWRAEDLSGLPEAETAARRLAEQERLRRFDLSVPPLVRLVLIKLSDSRHQMVITLHHIVLDGWSLPVLFDELSQVYAAGGDARVLPPVTPYKEYLAWLARQDKDAARAAWQRALAGTSEPTLVAGTDPGEASQPPRYVLEGAGREVSEALRGVARMYGLTLNTLIQAAWAVLVGQLAGRSDVVFGATVAGRPMELPGVERMLGLFVNTLPVRVRLDPARPVTEMLAELQARQSELIDHQHLGLAEIQRVAGPGAAFDTLFVYQNFPRDPGGALKLGGLQVSGTGSEDASHYPLTLVVTPLEELELRLDYRPDLFDDATATGLLARLVAVLGQVAADPQVRVSDVDVLSADERRLVVSQWNDTSRQVVDGPLAVLFERQVARTPGAVAVVFEDVVWTYAELDVRANRVAHELIARGVGAEDVVGVVMERSADLVAVVLGVAKAGAAYMPIDPGYPVERVAFMLADAAPAVVVCTKATEGLAGFDRLVWDDLATAAALVARPDTAPGDGDRRVPLRVGHPAYVIYTSGSTGTPKGVVVAHGGIGSLAGSQIDRFGVGPQSRVLQFAALGFDAAVSEMCMALLAGAGLVLAGADRMPPLGRLEDLVVGLGVTHVTVPPSLLATVEDLPGGLETVVVAGEACPPGLVAKWASGRRMFNAYGPTEATVCVTMSRALPAGLGEQSVVPIGGPIWNTRVLVLDEFLRPVPPGVVGELYVTGAGLARGYIGRAGLTSERFVASPFGSDGERMYRTGDLARWTAAGELVFAGRVDDQVKIRGFRVELGEIESVLAAHELVGQVAVIAREDQPGVKRLVAYVVPVGSGVSEGVLRGHVAARLPEYMVPAAFVVLDGLPVTVNGKLDRAALPAPDFAGLVTSRKPATAIEELLCGLFAEVLGLQAVGAEDSFFELGGDSIMSMLVVSRARRAGVEITARQVFEERTPAGLARVAKTLVETEPVDGDADVATGPVPLTPVMRELAERAGPMALTGRFCQSMLVTAPAGMVIERLVAAVQTVLDHHDTLRARLETPGDSVADGWRLMVPEPGAVPARECVHRIDVAGLDAQALAEAVLVQSREASARLDPRSGVLLQVVWLDAGPQTAGRLLVMVHHLAVDGVSWRVLLPDLTAAYSALEAGQEPVLEPVGTSFRRWAGDLAAQALSQERVGELPVWTRMLAGPDLVLGRRALDPQVDTVAAGTRRVAVQVPVSVTSALLTRVPAAFHAGIDDVLLAGLVAAVDEWRRSQGRRTPGGMLVDVEGHGRVAGDLARTVGWLTSEYPVRLDPGGIDYAGVRAGGPAASRLVKRIKEQLRAVPADGLGYGLLRYLNPATAPTLQVLPVPQIGFNYLGRFPAARADEPRDALAGWQPAGESALSGAADPQMAAIHSLDAGGLVQDLPEGPELTVTLVCPVGVLETTQLQELAAGWVDMLHGLVAHTVDPGSGGHTPSDFPLAEISQDELDEFEAIAEGIGQGGPAK